MPDDAPTEPPAADPIDRQVLILTTEHFTLVTQRGAMINEATGRATLHLTSVSMTMVALGFIAQATRLGDIFYLLAAVFLASLLLIGVLTFMRVVETGAEDGALARRVARVEAFYREVSPGAARWLDPRAARGDPIWKVMGGRPGWQIFLTTGSLVAAVNSVLTGALAGLAAGRLAGAALLPMVIVGALAFACAGWVHYAAQRTFWKAAENEDSGASN